MKQNLTKAVLEVAIRTLISMGRTYASLDLGAETKADSDNNLQQLLKVDWLSDSFKRKLKEHQINSNICKEATYSYRVSLDGLYNELQQELLTEGKTNEDNVHLRPPRAVGQGEIPPQQALDAEIQRRLAAIGGGGFAPPRDNRGDRGF